MELEIFSAHEYPQGENAWLELHRGIPSAGEFRKIVTDGGARSAQRKGYLQRKAIEILGCEMRHGYCNGNMQYGTDQEGRARAEYALLTGYDIGQIGFARQGRRGGSPDGLIGADGIIEIKTHASPEQFADAVLASSDKHRAQIQGNLLIQGRVWCDLIHRCSGLPIYCMRLYRREDYIRQLDDEINKFNEDLDRLVERLKDRLGL